MSPQDATSLRFPNGAKQFAFTEATPKVGDRLSLDDDEWEVVAVAEDVTGGAVVTLAPPSRENPRPTDGTASERNPPTLKALQEQAEVLKSVSASLRTSSKALIRDARMLRKSETDRD